jgi:hypothetical protein
LCGEPCGVWQLHATASAVTGKDAKELKVAWLQCHEEVKNLMANKNGNNKEHQDSR